MADDRDGRELLLSRRRNPNQNAQTVMDGQYVVFPPDLYRALFWEHYEAMAKLCRPLEEPGVVLAAIDPDLERLAGALFIAARPDRPAAAILGRHTGCDLYLPNREILSLRHLAIVVEPAKSFKTGPVDVAFRLIDLNTEEQFQDELCRDLSNARVEGTGFFRCGPYALFCFAVGDPTDWPSSAQDAWSFIPARVYFEDRNAKPLERVDTGPGSRAKYRDSIIRRLPRPRALDELIGKDEERVGELEIETRTGRVTLFVGERALSDGVLVGRYDRCQVATRLDDPTISRVHLLIVRAGTELVVIDTGSTAGTWLDGQRIGRIATLEDEADMMLGAHTHLRWRARGA
jgi:hypothetical protein